MTNTLFSEVGDRLRKLREINGLNQSEVSEALGIKRSAWSNWEIGVANPKVEDGKRIAAYFGVDLNYLYGFTDERNVENPAQSLQIRHADSSSFENQGLRKFFEYRQLGAREATNGDFGAHVIRAVPGEESPGRWHSHQLDFQLVYVTKGWVVFEYEGEGEHILRAGSSVLQPPGIVHREVGHSDDLELIEITKPADFETREAVSPV